MRKKHQRKQWFVDRQVQGALMLRFVGYWCLGLAVMFALLASVPILLAICFPFVRRPTILQILAGSWSLFWPSMVVSLLILPAVLRDLVKMSNRFVGPVLRLRRSMRALADGQPVQPVIFREGDYWFDFAEDFNRLAEASRSHPTPVAVETESTSREASAAPHREPSLGQSS